MRPELRLKLETAWLAASEPESLLKLVLGRASERKLRLLAYVCCDGLRGLLDRRSIFALEYLERSLEKGLYRRRGRYTIQAVADAATSHFHRLVCSRPGDAKIDTLYSAAAAISHCVGPDPNESTNRAVHFCALASSVSYTEERTAQVPLIRDIFGNPFRRVDVKPTWRTWNDGTVIKLAQAIYDERELPSGHLDAGRLAILADALEDAGCQNTDVLSHCRTPGPHVRGCWVVDLLLGKE